jgi:hypothetical protein
LRRHAQADPPLQPLPGKPTALVADRLQVLRNVCRQAEHRERHRFRRCRTASAPTASAPIKLRDQRVTAADIEALMAATDATVERVMANVSKIVKPSAKGSHDCNPQLLRRVSESPILAGAVLWFA